MIGKYNLLCNACNWEFVGFAVPGTLEAHSARRRKKRAEQKNQQPLAPIHESKEALEDFEEAETVSKSPHRIKVRKRVRVKLKK